MGPLQYRDTLRARYRDNVLLKLRMLLRFHFCRQLRPHYRNFSRKCVHECQSTENYATTKRPTTERNAPLSSMYPTTTRAHTKPTSVRRTVPTSATYNEPSARSSFFLLLPPAALLMLQHVLLQRGEGRRAFSTALRHPADESGTYGTARHDALKTLISGTGPRVFILKLHSVTRTTKNSHSPTDRWWIKSVATVLSSHRMVGTQINHH